MVRALLHGNPHSTSYVLPDMLFSWCDAHYIDVLKPLQPNTEVYRFYERTL